METIRKTASHIITGIEDKLLEKTSIKDKLAAAEKKAEASKENKVTPKQVPVLA